MCDWTRIQRGLISQSCKIFPQELLSLRRSNAVLLCLGGKMQLGAYWERRNRDTGENISMRESFRTISEHFDVYLETTTIYLS